MIGAIFDPVLNVIFEAALRERTNKLPEDSLSFHNILNVSAFTDPAQLLQGQPTPPNSEPVNN